jgi:hypothetical protein
MIWMLFLRVIQQKPVNCKVIQESEQYVDTLLFDYVHVFLSFDDFL